MSTFPYAEISNIFNPNDFGSIGETLSLTEADLRYIRQGGPANVSSLMINSQPVDFSAISGVVAGVAQGGKALILNSTGNITGINDLSSSFLKVSNTSSTTISNFAIGSTYGLHLHGVNSAMGKLAGAAISFNIDSTDGIPLASITLDKISSGVGALCIATRNGSLLDERVRFQPSGNVSIGSNTDTHKLYVNGTLSATNITGTLATAAQTNITSVGTLTNLTLSTGGTGLQIPNLKFWNSTTSLYDNFNHSQYIGTTLGGAVASKALIVDANKDIGSIRNLNAVSINGSTSVSGTLGDFGGLNIDGTLVLTSSRNIVNVGTIATSGAIDSAYGLTIGGVDAITSSGIYGTLQTAAQPYIESLGTLTSLNVNGDIVCTATPGITLSTTSVAGSYDMEFRNVSNVSGATCGISFGIHSNAALSTFTPTASIIASSTGTPASNSHTPSNISFYTRQSQIQVGGALQERMRIHGDGKFSFGDIGDSRYNFLHALNSPTMRFGTTLTLKDCISLTWNYVSSGSVLNHLAFNIYGTSNALCIMADDKIGVGTNTPAAGLDVSSYASVSMAGPLATGTSSAYTVNRSGTFTDSVSIYCRQAFMCGTRGMYVGSDRRVKEDISSIPPEDGVKFVRDIDPKIYTLKSLDKRQIGYISQDMLADYSALISMIPDPNMTIEQEGDVDGAFLSLSYERVPAFLHAALKSVLDRLDAQDVIIEEMKATIATLT